MRSEVLVIGHAVVTRRHAAQLRSAGHSAWTAGDVEEARRLLERDWIHPKLLVIDLTADEAGRAWPAPELAALAAAYELPVILIGAADAEATQFSAVQAVLAADAPPTAVIEAIARFHALTSS